MGFFDDLDNEFGFDELDETDESGGSGDDFDMDGFNDNPSDDWGDMDGGFDNDNSADSFDNGSDWGGLSNDNFESSSDDWGLNNSNEDNLSTSVSDSSGDGNEKKKVAVIVIAVGIVVIGITLILVTKLGKKSKTSSNRVVSTQTEASIEKNISSVSNSTNENWKEIELKQSIKFNDEYSTMNFTVTGIKARARTVSASGDLEVNAYVTGSLSGVSGTYSLDIPYDKASLLYIGNVFEVKVLLGEYNGKTIIGDIKY